MIDEDRFAGFTIIELLVVISVIGILAAITIVSYTGISGRAVSASLQSDLSNASSLLKMYSVEYGAYPTTLSASYCPTAPIADSKYCLKASPGNSFAYIPNGPSYQSFNFYGGNSNGTIYTINSSSSPTLSSLNLLNGTESWGGPDTPLYATVSAFYLNGAGPLRPYGTNPICAKFAFSPNTESEGSNYSGAGYFEIRILKSRLATNDVAGFKAWLASNNVNVIMRN